MQRVKEESDGAVSATRAPTDDRHALRTLSRACPGNGVVTGTEEDSAIAFRVLRLYAKLFRLSRLRGSNTKEAGANSSPSVRRKPVLVERHGLARALSWYRTRLLWQGRPLAIGSHHLFKTPPSSPVGS